MVDAKFKQAVAMGCGFCGVDRKRRSQEERDDALEGHNPFPRIYNEREEYTCYLCGGRLLVQVGHVIVARTGETAWFSQPRTVDAYEFYRHGLRALNRS